MTRQEKALDLAKKIGPVFNVATTPGSTNKFTIHIPEEYKVQGIKINCGGCTKLYSVEDNKIEAAFVVSKNFVPNAVQKKQQEEHGFYQTEYNNFFHIFFDDGNPLYVFNDNRILGDHPEKLWLKYDMKAKVTVPKK